MPQPDQLDGNLTRLQELLCELRRMVLQEREDITDLNLARLQERRAAIESLFGTVRAVSDETKSRIEAMCAAAGLQGAGTLTQLAATLPAPDREQLLRLQQGIRTAAAEVEHAVSVNRAILQDSLAFINQSLLMFTNMLKNSSTYGQAGRYVESVDGARIINKEI
jgi:hypothetical protein